MQMGISFESEVSNEGIVKVLQQYVQQYLPNDGEEENITTVEQGVVGDKLTIERAANAVKSMANGYTPEERQEGFQFGIGDWHAGKKFLSEVVIICVNIQSILHPFLMLKQDKYGQLAFHNLK